MYLTVDETLTILAGQQGRTVRLRIWRRADYAPVVLVSQIEGGPEPSEFTERLANLVFGAFLGLTPTGMFYFESALDGGLKLVDFEAIGKHTERLRLCRPRRTEFTRSNLEAVIGQAVEW